MFVLTAGALYYTGRAGSGWVSADRAEAFPFSLREGAERKAEWFNQATCLHGLTFTVTALKTL